MRGRSEEGAEPPSFCFIVAFTMENKFTVEISTGQSHLTVREKKGGYDPFKISREKFLFFILTSQTFLLTFCYNRD